MVDTAERFEIDIDKKRLYRRLGYSNGYNPRPAIVSIIDEAIEEAHDLIQPSCSYQIMDVKRIRRPKVTLVNSIKITITSDVMSWVLTPCEQALVFVCSIGPKIEERVANLMKEGQMLKASILDAIGSEAAERAAEHLQKQVREIANAGDAEITLRYSPGYCDWDITQQRLLFRAVDSENTEVELTNECLMTPKKSISGIIGVGWGEKRRLRLSPCRFCTRQDCNNRR
jgi:hypothetical protein